MTSSLSVLFFPLSNQGWLLAHESGTKSIHICQELRDPQVTGVRHGAAPSTVLVTQRICIALLTANLLSETFGGRWQLGRIIQPKAFACIKARSCNAQPAMGAAAVQYIPSQVQGGGGTGSRSLSPRCQTSPVKGRERVQAAD